MSPISIVLISLVGLIVILWFVLGWMYNAMMDE